MFEEYSSQMPLLLFSMLFPLMTLFEELQRDGNKEIHYRDVPDRHILSIAQAYSLIFTFFIPSDVACAVDYYVVPLHDYSIARALYIARQRVKKKGLVGDGFLWWWGWLGSSFQD
ncbi:MAG: hypothetical protein QXS66_01885 [Thermoproteota archaeon]